MNETVYIETSVVSYFTSRPSRDLIIAARQEITHENGQKYLQFLSHTFRLWSYRKLSRGMPKQRRKG